MSNTDQTKARTPLLRILVPAAGGALVALCATWLMSRGQSPEPARVVAQEGVAVSTGDGSGSPQRGGGARGAMTGEQLAALKESKIAEAEKRQLAQYDAFQAQYGIETADPAWAGAQEIRMLEASTHKLIQDAGALPNNFQAACRASSCKIDADFPNRGLAEDFAVLFANAMGNEMPNMSFKHVPGPNGGSHLEAYGLRRK